MTMEKFDVAVVGAGPAGSSAAYALAKAGLSVLLVERGGVPGSKNMFGGRIYAYALARLFPDFPSDCPVERWIGREGMAFMTEDSALWTELETPVPTDRATASFTALRSRFDKWMAERAEGAGAMVITGIRVDDLWREEGRVRGIVAGGDRVQADVVVAADGVVSHLARRAGLRADLEPREVSVGVKETWELPPRAVEERFNLEGDIGAAFIFAGYASRFLRGGGFLYTNRTSVSIGVVVKSEDLSYARVPVHEVMEAFRVHPAVAKYLKGGKVVEYSTHMIPELAAATPVRRRGDGILAVGDAAGFLINNGYTFRGVDLAVVSGMAAAKAAVRAREKGDFSAGGLASYEEALEESSVLGDLRTFGRAPGFLENRRLYSVYPKVLVDAARDAYAVEGTGKERASKGLRRAMKGRVSTLRALMDLLAGARSL
jgi:electron transfer flavoprotein-quinone oxidoreductase